MSDKEPRKCNKGKKAEESIKALREAIHNSLNFEKSDRSQIEEADKNLDTSAGEAAEAILNLILLESENDEYNYEYIHEIGLQLSRVSSDLLEIAFKKEGVPDATGEAIQNRIAILLKKIFLHCC
jgi:UV DNA damage repair endonuclease